MVEDRALKSHSSSAHSPPRDWCWDVWEGGMGGCLVGPEGGSVCWAGISAQPQKSTDVNGIWVWWAPKWCTNQLERSLLRADGWRGLPRQWVRQVAASKSGVESQSTRTWQCRKCRPVTAGNRLCHISRLSRLCDGF